MGEHAQLLELGIGQPQDVLNAPSDLLGFVHRRRVGKQQLGLRGPAGEALPPPLGKQLLGLAGDGVAEAPVGELQGHGRFSPGIGEIAAQAAGLPVLPAALPKQGVGDGVKQGGFARAGIPGDEKHAVQTGKIHLRAPRVRAESGQDKPHGLHGSTSRFFRVFDTISRCSPFRGRPVISA